MSHGVCAKLAWRSTIWQGGETLGKSMEAQNTRKKNMLKLWPESQTKRQENTAETLYWEMRATAAKPHGDLWGLD